MPSLISHDPFDEVITELPAADQAAIERRSGEMADAERRIEIMRRAALRNPEK